MVKDTYTIGEASAILKKSVKTLQRWDNSGKLKANRTSTNRRVYPKDRIFEMQTRLNQINNNDLLYLINGMRFNIISTFEKEFIKIMNYDSFEFQYKRFDTLALALYQYYSLTTFIKPMLILITPINYNLKKALSSIETDTFSNTINMAIDYVSDYKFTSDIQKLFYKDLLENLKIVQNNINSYQLFIEFCKKYTA